MKNDYSHITIILDRSGSMESIRDDTIGGFNAFLNQQKKEPGMATLTLVQFDTQDSYEVVHQFLPIALVPVLTNETYVPRAGTPLLDAMGRGINDLDAKLALLKEEDRPSKVVVVTVTDGQENSSREFTKAQVEKMIKEKTAQKDWQFVFLSADMGAIDEAVHLGVAASAALPFQKSARGTADAWESLGARTADYRASRKKKLDFDDEDRKHPDDKNASA